MTIAKKLAILLALIIAVNIAYAACTDTDGGPIDPAKPTKFLGIKGSVDYGTGPKEDYCVSRQAGSGVPDSNWVREYYCDGDDIASKDYFCRDYDYDSCEAGVCINYTGTQAALDDVGTPPPKETYENCGNGKLDGTEECDPPGKVCMPYGGGMATCSDQCKCTKRSQTNETNQTQVNQTIEPTNGTQTVEVKFELNETKKEVIEADEPEEEPEETGNTPTGALPADIQEIIQETNEEVEDFSQKPGIRLTSAISNFAKKMWSWFIGLFGG